MIYPTTAGELARALQDAGLLKALKGTALITEISYDSRKIGKHTLFVCKGAAFKPEYLTMAMEAGTVCYLAEEDYHVSLPCLIVSDVRKALSIVSIHYYQRPFDAFGLVGITGTKGKTTTTYMMKGILDAYAGESTGILSTVETFTGGEVRESHLTTPESLDLQRMFDEARANHLRYVTMEVSSQAYKHSRAYGISYDVGVFLNIDEDHIGPLEHTDYEDYLSCKLELVKNSRIAVINSLTRDFARVVEAARSVGAKVVRFGAEGDDYSIRNIRKLQSGFCFEVFGPNHWNAEFSIDLEGRFNMTNALAAIAAAKELGVDDDSIRRGIQSIFVPGRMNIYRKNGALVLVDYAHNHLSFTELFESLKKDYPGQPVKVVCGCPGHKNMRRRRDIGLLCGKYASKVYLTAEDPGFESVEEICEEMAEYVRMDQRAEYVIIPDRAQAVKTSLEEAKEGDIIIVAGKGEEIYQKVCGEYLPYESDVVIVREWAQNDKGDQNADC